MQASLLGTSRRSDGKLQVTYNGHPLYLFARDNGAGQTNDQGVSAFGALWYVLSPAGSAITAAAPSSAGADTAVEGSYRFHVIIAAALTASGWRRLTSRFSPIQRAYSFDHVPSEEEIADVLDRWLLNRSLAVSYLFLLGVREGAG